MRKSLKNLTRGGLVLVAAASMFFGCKKQQLLTSDSAGLKKNGLRANSLFSAGTAITYIDYSTGPDKFVEMVNGNPYFMTNIQVRMDKLRHTSTYGWNWTQCDALVGQAASDGFNTISVPVQWYEVEPSKNNFDWTVLDQYLSMTNKYNLKMELLWFGANSTGSVGGMGDSADPLGWHLRTPDYVLYAPSPGSTATTSDYTIDRSYGNYTLDITDTAYRNRETYVLTQVMNHIASWDNANGSKHPVIGVQLNNEFKGGSHNTPTACINYLNGIGAGVKNSNYVVWTRVNCQHDETDVTNKINYNETLRNGTGTNIDFIGIDNYSHIQTDIQSTMPTIGKNFKMVMENGGSNVGQIKLAALAGNTAFDTYNMCGPDTGEGLYSQTSQGSYAPSGSNITSVRAVNHLLQTDPVDLAVNSQGAGLFVHNWAETSVSPTTGGILAITYTPSSTTDVGISIKRSSSEIVLMSLYGGTFTYQSSMGVTGATTGSFDANNTWVSTGSVTYTSTSVTLTAGQTVRLTYTGGPGIPSAPTGLSATAGDTQVSLSWSASGSATSYNVKESTSSSGPYTTIGTVSGTTFTATGLTNSTSYYFEVSAVNSAGESANSSAVSATPVVTGPAPTLVGLGAATADSIAITPPLPANISSGDILLLFVETANQTASISNQNGGTWTALNSAATGTAGGSDGVKLTVYWSRYNGTQGAPTLADPGDHQLATIMAIRGAVATGTPYNVTANGVDTYVDKGATIPGGTTTISNTYVVEAVAGALPDANGSDNFLSWTNANLTGLTEVFDNTTAKGNGGALGIAAGVKAVPGAIGNTSASLAVATKKALISIAIRP